MIEYREQHPDTELDDDRYLNWNAWANTEEDFQRVLQTSLAIGRLSEQFLFAQRTLTKRNIVNGNRTTF